MAQPTVTAPAATVASAFADRYRIERELGRGGMGAVYLARDVTLDRPVALKVLPPEFASDGSLRERFLRETRVTASFSHPNIVPVYSVEERDGLLAFAMGYVEGESLAERVRRLGPVDSRTIVRVLQDVGYALAYAHGRGVIHRDIKPDNIMIERATGRALLMDFGISRAAGGGTTAAPGLTRVGEVVGTPEFMSPEQATGDEIDGRSDLYSLGLVALFALTGSAPITGSSVAQIITKQLTQLPPPAATLRGDIPDALGAAIDRCVAKQPEERFQGAESLVEAIDAAQLAPAEIPVPIRMFAQELQSLGLIIFFLLLMSWLIFQNAKQFGNLNISLPVVMILAVAVTRFVENYFTAKRLGTFGFSAGDVLKGFRGVLNEHEEHRRRLRADPATVRRRKGTVRRALIQIPIAFALMAFAFRGRVKVGPGQYHVSALNVTIAISGLCLLGVSLVLLVRSPFRAQLNERLFRLLWLGPVGRGFLRRAVG
jgi:serine/threonine-protein kinase